MRLKDAQLRCLGEEDAAAAVAMGQLLPSRSYSTRWRSEQAERDVWARFWRVFCAYASASDTKAARPRTHLGNQAHQSESLMSA